MELVGEEKKKVVIGKIVRGGFKYVMLSVPRSEFPYRCAYVTIRAIDGMSARFRVYAIKLPNAPNMTAISGSGKFYGPAMRFFLMEMRRRGHTHVFIEDIEPSEECPKRPKKFVPGQRRTREKTEAETTEEGK